jgi:hemin uptake protein HemP
MLPKTEAIPLTRIKVAAALPRRISSESLLGAERELVIVHNGREYRLRLTQLGKLILTA